MYFLLFDGENPGLVKNAEVELVMKPRHPSHFDSLFSQILICFELTLMCPVEIFFKRDRQLNNETIF